MGQRLLLVDSDRSFLKEHRVSLDAAFDLELAGPLDGVLPRLESGIFSAALICAEVGDNKGYALCSAIRKNPKLDGVKIALISAKASEEEYRRHQGLKGRADVYLHKPIAPSTLVSALAPLVPSRVLDPDSPLGELADIELGDDWLDGLKNALEGPAGTRAATPVFGIRPSSPSSPSHPDSAIQGERLRLLEEQVRVLQEDLLAKEQQLLKAEAEAQDFHRQMSSVTVNLEELERGNREVEALKAQLAESEQALRGQSEGGRQAEERAEALEARLQESHAERAGLDQQAESLRQQLGEEARRVRELLEERDGLILTTRELEPFQAQAQALEAQLEASGVARDQALALKQEELEAVLVAQDQALANKQEELEAALAAKQEELEAALAAKQEELVAIGVARDQALSEKQEELASIRSAQDQLNQTLEALVAQHASLEDRHQSTQLELAGQMERLHASQLEIAGLEATMRGQGRDLAELGIQLREREAERDANQAQVLARDQQLLERDQRAQQHQQELAGLTDQIAGLNQELVELRAQHDGEQLELMNALDLKDAQILGLHQLLAEKEASLGALERDKLAVQSELSEQRERLQNLGTLLQEIQDQLQRGSDLARS